MKKKFIYVIGSSTFTVNVELDLYRNKRIAIMLNEEDGEPFLVASVNEPTITIPEGHAIIKTYSENEGVLDFLISHKITSEPTEYCNLLSGIRCPIVKVLPEADWISL